MDSQLDLFGPPPDAVSFTERMRQAPDADAGRKLITDHAAAINSLERSLGFTPSCGQIHENWYRAFACVKPQEWTADFQRMSEISPFKASELYRLIEDGKSMDEPWKALYRREMAGTYYQDIDGEHLPELPCPECQECKRHAYSDATTPGFFYDKCEKHREEVKDAA